MILVKLIVCVCGVSKFRYDVSFQTLRVYKYELKMNEI